MWGGRENIFAHTLNFPKEKTFAFSHSAIHTSNIQQYIQMKVTHRKCNNNKKKKKAYFECVTTKK